MSEHDTRHDTLIHLEACMTDLRTAGTVKEMSSALHTLTKQLSGMQKLIKSQYNESAAKGETLALAARMYRRTKSLQSVIGSTHYTAEVRGEFRRKTNDDYRKLAEVAGIVFQSPDMTKLSPTVKQDGELPSSGADLDLDGLTSYSEYVNSMPGIASTEPFKVLDLPLVVRFNSPVTIKQLSRAGFQAVEMAGYIMLDNCTVIGINKSYCTAEHIEPDKFVRAVIQKQEELDNRKWTLVDDASRSYKTGGWCYYWVMPSRYLYNFLNASGKSMGAADWGFPFN